MRTGYLASFVAATVLAFCAAVAFHEFRSVDLALMPTVVRANGKVLLFGNSVNRTISRCDTDTRTLPDMLNAPTGPAIVNLSRGGMPLSQMLRMAELAALAGVKPKVVVIPVAFGDLLQLADAPVGMQGFARDNLPHWLQPAASEPTAFSVPQDYKGRHYGSYGTFSKTHFEREKKASHCPETIGQDHDFIEFMFWRSYLQPVDPTAGLQPAVERALALQQRGVQVLFWFPPVNYEDLASLHGAENAAAVKARLATLAAALSARSLKVLDTSEGVPATGFTDRWCACGHLNQAGRQALATQMRNSLARQLGASSAL